MNLHFLERVGLMEKVANRTGTEITLKAAEQEFLLDSFQLDN